MKIKTRLLLLFLPTILTILLSLSFIIYQTWHHDLLSHYKEDLLTIVESTASLIDSENHSFLLKHSKDPSLTDHPRYIYYSEKLQKIRKVTPSLSSLYVSHIQEINEGTIQRLLADSEPNQRAPGERIPLEHDEEIVYQTKKSSVSISKDNTLYAVAPIFDKHNEVIGLISADISLNFIRHKELHSLWLIFIGALFASLLIVVAVACIANNISQPIEALKNGAITLASGNWKKKIEVKGPKEVSELAHTLNTMGDCLKEQLERLEENALLREKMIGEIECIKILERSFFNKVASHFWHPHIALKALSTESSHTHNSLLLHIEKNESKEITLSLLESVKKGFDGMYSFMTSREENKRLTLSLKMSKKNEWQASFDTQTSSLPYYWTKREKNLKPLQQNTSLFPEDSLLLTNTTLFSMLQSDKATMKRFQRVFAHFSNEGLDHCSSLLLNECLFLTKRHHIDEPLQALIVEIKRSL